MVEDCWRARLWAAMGGGRPWAVVGWCGPQRRARRAGLCSVVDTVGMVGMVGGCLCVLYSAVSGGRGGRRASGAFVPGLWLG